MLEGDDAACISQARNFLPPIQHRNKASRYTNSPKSAELRAISEIGVLDGTTCEVWPKELDFSAASNPVGVLQSAASALDGTYAQIPPIVERMGVMGIDHATAIGSKHTLRVRVAAGVASDNVVVAFDPYTLVGYAISNRWLCTPSEVSRPLGASDGCVMRNVSIPDYGTIQILRRSTPRPQPAAAAAPVSGRMAEAVVLVAPEIVFPRSITVDIDLIAIADEMFGGERPLLNSAVDTPTTTVTAKSAAYAVSSSNWRSALKVPLQPSFIVLDCDQCRGIFAITAETATAVKTVAITTRNRLNSSGLLEINASEVFAPSITNRNDGRGGPYTSHPRQRGLDPTCLRLETRWYQWTRKINLPGLPAFRDAYTDGGVASASCGAGCSPTTATALRTDPVFHAIPLDRYAGRISQIVDQALDVQDCFTTKVRYVGPPGEQEKKCWIDCRESTVEVCLEGRCARFAHDSSVKDRVYAWVSGVVADHFHQLQPPANARLGVAGVAGDGFFVGQFLSRGLFFDQLADEADNQSLRHAAYSDRWTKLSENLRAVPSAVSPQTHWPSYAQWMHRSFDIDAPALKDAFERGRAAAIYAHARSALNAVDAPSGRVAASWYPTGISNPTLSVRRVRERWDQIADLVENFGDAVDGQLTASQISLLAEGGADYLDLATSVASEQVAAAHDSRVDHQRTLDRLDTAAQELETLHGRFEEELLRIWDCTDVGIDGCATVMRNSIEALSRACEARTGGPFDSLFDAVLSFVPIAGDVIDGLRGFASAFDVIKAVGGWFNAFDSLQQTVDAFDNIEKVLDNVEKGIGYVKKAQGWNRQFNDWFSLGVSECRDPAAIAEIHERQTMMTVLDAILEQMEIQMRVILSATSAFAADVEYLGRMEHTGGQLVAATPALAQQLRSLAGHNPHSRAFFSAACETAQAATRAGLRDLHAASSMLETSAGRPAVSYPITVPSTSTAADAQYGFLLSIWDLGSYRTTFASSGAGITQPSIKRIADRFDELVNGPICRNDPQPDLPRSRFVVRKRIEGDALATFLQTGRVDVAIELDDMIAAGERAGTDLSAVVARRATTQAFDTPLSAPVVLAVGYAACDAGGCDRELALDQPYVVTSAAPQVATTDCDPEANWQTSTIGVAALGDVFMQACLSSVAAPRVTASLVATNATWSDTALADAFIEAPICSVTDPQAIGFRPIRGMPLLGDWSLVFRGTAATNVARELSAGAPVVAPPSATWRSANGWVSGIDLLFFAAAEPLGGNAAPAYQQAN